MDKRISDASFENDTGIVHWKRVWEEGNYTFHSDMVHPKLVKYFDTGLNHRSHLRVIVPLCGKTVDMKYLYDKGHHVVGVDCSSIAIEEFFSKQALKFTCDKMTTIDGKRYQNEDGRIILYCCDLFSFTDAIHGKFDFMWDRAAMYAIKPCDRSKYVQTMCSLMDDGAVGFIETLDFDQIKDGSPYAIAEEDMRKLYSQYDLQLFETINYFDIRPDTRCQPYFPAMVDCKMWLVQKVARGK